MMNAIDGDKDVGHDARKRNHHVREIFVAPAKRIDWRRFSPTNQRNDLPPPIAPKINISDGNQKRSDRICVRHRVERDSSQQPRGVVAKLVRHPGVRRLVCRDREQQHDHVNNELWNQLFCVQLSTRVIKMLV